MKRLWSGIAFALVTAGCGSKSGTGTGTGTGTASGETPMPVVLRVAPPLPEVPMGLPAVDLPATPDEVALGAIVFADPRLSASGKTSCETCHAASRGYAGATRQTTDAGKPNLRRAPALVNLAWVKELGWDGRYASLSEQLATHVKGQLGELAPAVARLDADPTIHAHFARTGGATEATVISALAAFVVTRYAGSPWDAIERLPAPPCDLKAGYALFTTKAQCATCHAPPMYTDLAYHRLGLIASPDEGRGRIDPAQKGAFRTPTLRGAALRGGFFHDASAPTLDAAIDWHLGGGLGQGADPSIIDQGLSKVVLTTNERAQLGAFVAVLTTSPKGPPEPCTP